MRSKTAAGSVFPALIPNDMKWLSAIWQVREGRAWPTLLLFALVLCVLFHEVFLPGQTLFANDGPLGELMAQCHRLPGRFTGCWQDLNNVGFNAGSTAPGISMNLQWLLGPVWFSKFYAILSLFILGSGAWCFFRQSGLAPLACVLGGLAAMLNATFFSVACWGVGAHAIAAGTGFFALAALVDGAARRFWLRAMLAGFAVGMAVVEAADVGALFSLLVAGFIVYQAVAAGGSRLKNIGCGMGQLILVVVCAVFLAAQSLVGLVNVSIKGVAGTGQDSQTKAQQWDWATQWSLPKRETLSLLVPGLFGFRMDTPDGGNYWGMIGRDAAWEKYLADGGQGAAPTGYVRFSGSGNYSGELVLLLATWAGAQSLRRKNSAFEWPSRKWIWFWGVVAVVSLLLAFGRYAPCYQFIYRLPYASTIRNPTKFLYLFSAAVTVLCAFGVDGLDRKYMQAGGAGGWSGLGKWWRGASRFEKNWVYGCGFIVGAGLVAWRAYAGHQSELEEYLRAVQMGPASESAANFSIRQALWFPLVFALAAGLMILVFSRAFAGRRAQAGGLLLGLFLVLDFGVANRPWMVFWNYPEKYASNPVIDLMRQAPYEHRVGLVPLTPPPKLMALPVVYRQEWLQQLFPFYDIQSFDVVEMSRIPEDFKAFREMVDPATVGSTTAWRNMIRAWQLTNTRYLLTLADGGPYWNEQYFPASTLPRIAARFAILPKPGVLHVTDPEQVTAVPDDNGPYALFEYAAALPRAKLYARWQVNPNAAATLEKIFDPGFDPQNEVIVAGGVAESATNTASDVAAGRVDFAGYAPKDMVLNAEAAAPSVLLLNDHYDQDWKVWVDGRPDTLLRCNYLMRGVYLAPGSHLVEFKFQPPVRLLYVSLAAILLALLGLGYLWFSDVKSPAVETCPDSLPVRNIDAKLYKGLK